MSDLESILKARLDVSQNEKQSIRENLDSFDTKVKNLIGKIDKFKDVRRDKDDELASRIVALEYKHDTTSGSNADERQFMRDLDNLKNKRKEISEYKSIQIELDELKLQRSVLQKDLRDKEKSVDELFVGLRKVKIANKLGCNTEDIIEQNMMIPQDKLGQVVGRGGATMKKIEIDCGVNIDTNRNQKINNESIIRFTGTELSISNAISAINLIVSTDTIEISPSDEAIICMTVDKAALTQDIQTRCNVRIDVSRAKKLCKISGLIKDVEAAKKEIDEIDCSHSEIPVEIALLSFIIGKGGATIKFLGEGRKVQIDVVRLEGSSESISNIHILGAREDVEVVTETLNSIIHENKEIEENIQTDRATMLGCFVGPGGSIIRQLQNEFKISIQVERGSEKTGDEKTEKIVLKGATSKIIPAKLRLSSMLQEYLTLIKTMVVEQQYLSMIVGKKGSKINEIRDKYPGSNIDIDGTIIRIYCENRDFTKLIQKDIESIIAANYTREWTCDTDTAILFKSLQGKDSREALQGLGLSIDVDPSNENMKVKGSKENVDIGIDILDAFNRKYYSETLSCSEDDCGTLLDGGVDGPAKKSEAEFDVEIYVNKKDGIVRIRGLQSSVDAAKSSLLGLLGGDAMHGAVLLDVDPLAFSSLIGKKGANLKKMETDFNVKIDMLKTTDKVRLRGLPENIENARKSVKDQVFAARITSVILVSIDSVKNESKHISDVSLIYGIEITKKVKENTKEYEITLKGLLNLVNDARKHLNELLTDSALYSINLQNHQVDIVSIRSSDGHLKRLGDKIGNVNIGLDLNVKCINISGSFDSVQKGKLEMYRLLDSLFPSEFMSIAMSLKCLKDVGSHKNLLIINDLTNASLTSDRSCSCIRVNGENVSNIMAAAQLIKDNITKWNGCHASLDVQEFMLSMIVGKNGANIISLEKESNCKININKSKMQVDIDATEVSILNSGIEIIKKRIDQIQKENWITKLDSNVCGLIIGAKGATIKQLRADLECQIDIDAKTNVIQISGKADKVVIAREKINEMIKENAKKNHSVDYGIEYECFPLIIGTKGSTIIGIQEDTKARLDIDRDGLKLTLRGSVDCCDKALEVINDLLKNNGFSALKIYVEKKKAIIKNPVPISSLDSDREAPISNNSKKITSVVGATPEMIAQIQERMKYNIGKNALRRLRRKERKEQSNDSDNEVDNDDEYVIIDDVSSLPTHESPLTVTETSPLPNSEIKQSNTFSNSTSSNNSSLFSIPPPIETTSVPLFSRGPGIIGSPIASSHSSPSSILTTATTTKTNVNQVDYGMGVVSPRSTRLLKNPPGFTPPRETGEKTTSNIAKPAPISFTNTDSKPSSSTTAATSSSSYYKSKSGFSIRL
jgi:transcription antitermination factor NusA-like protein